MLNLGKVFIVSGCAKSWDITIRDKAGVVVDVSDATEILATFVMDMNDGTRTPIFSKSLTIGDVVLTDAVHGVISILFAPEETQSYNAFTTLDYGVKVYLPGSTVDEEDVGHGLAFIRISPVKTP